MTDMTERAFYNDLDDAAADWQPEGGDWDIDPTPLAYPEWNRRRTEAGLPAGTFTEYLSEMYPRRGDGEQESND